MADPLDDLTRARVAIWLDDLSRPRPADGSLTRLIPDCHVVGVTTNPTIFHDAIVGSDYYDRQIGKPALQGVDIEDVLRRITTCDVSSPATCCARLTTPPPAWTGGCRSRSTRASRRPLSRCLRPRNAAAEMGTIRHD